MKSLGAVGSLTRTADQTQIARFWGLRSRTTGTRSPRRRRWHTDDPEQNARLFALLDLSLADSVIAFYDAKYTYHFWRPITAIRAADNDGNPATAADPNWTPLATTALDPSYPGAHAVVSAAGADVLSRFFGNDEDFAVTSEVLPGVERTFTSFSDAADEASPQPHLRGAALPLRPGSRPAAGHADRRLRHEQLPPPTGAGPPLSPASPRARFLPGAGPLTPQGALSK